MKFDVDTFWKLVDFRVFIFFFLRKQNYAIRDRTTRVEQCSRNNRRLKRTTTDHYYWRDGKTWRFDRLTNNQRANLPGKSTEITASPPPLFSSQPLSPRVGAVYSNRTETHARVVVGYDNGCGDSRGCTLFFNSSEGLACLIGTGGPDRRPRTNPAGIPRFSRRFRFGEFTFRAPR